MYILWAQGKWLRDERLGDSWSYRCNDYNPEKSDDNIVLMMHFYMSLFAGALAQMCAFWCMYVSERVWLFVCVNKPEEKKIYVTWYRSWW